MKFTSGLPETLCGAGSTLRSTSYLRPRLLKLLRKLDIKILLDAPCGDHNWMARLRLDGILYIGVDYSEENLAAARRRSPYRAFERLDIVSDALPYANLMLCRDFHQHLTNERVEAALGNFVFSGIAWLLATSFDIEAEPYCDNPDIDHDGGFRRINLCAEPFCLPEPVEKIADPPGSGRWLCLWHRDQLNDQPGQGRALHSAGTEEVQAQAL